MAIMMNDAEKMQMYKYQIGRLHADLRRTSRERDNAVNWLVYIWDEVLTDEQRETVREDAPKKFGKMFFDR